MHALAQVSLVFADVRKTRAKFSPFSLDLSIAPKTSAKKPKNFTCIWSDIKNKRKEPKIFAIILGHAEIKRIKGRRRGKLNNNVIKELKQEKRELTALIARLIRDLSEAPSGSLRVNNTKGRKVQYYQYISDNKNAPTGGVYLGADKYKVARRLAQKGYDAKLLEWAKRAEYRLGNLLDSYEHTPPEIIYNNLSDIKRQMVVPYYVPDDVFLENWLRKWHCGGNTYDKKEIILTERGEQVRSKSEKIIADKLYSEGIPYVYEPEVILDDGERVYPDFAALNVRTRKEFFFEHFGKMDELAYCKKNIRKIEEYALSGYTLGDGLLATFETNGSVFDSRYLDVIVKKYLK